ncbi:hypothetical protein VTH82DRAFT_5608 [Thermothelomyces myriococcoides]
MRTSTTHPPAKPPDSPADDSDTDLELDLEELNPQTVSGSDNQPRRRGLLGKPRQPPAEERTPRIALRTLRMNGLRRGARRNGYGELGRSHVGPAENALGDGYGYGGDDRRYSDASAAAGDDAPLLSEPGGGGGRSRSRSRSPSKRRGSFASDKLRRVGLRLPSFLSGGPANRDRAAEDEELDKEEDDPSSSRLVAVGSSQSTRFPPNIISNAKYTAWSFLPVTLYNEFSFFFNMYFLLVALSQAIPALRIGYLSTYVAPLAFVLVITLGKEAYDDIERRRRDNEANSEEYIVLQFEEPGRATVAGARLGARKSTLASARRGGPRRNMADAGRLSDIQEEEEQTEGDGARGRTGCVVSEVSKKSRDLRVGDVLKLSKGDRVPSDVVILKCLSNDPAAQKAEEGAAGREESLLLDHGATEEAAAAAAAAEENPGAAEGGSNGETFIRTDQLDGETDWKLRLASPLSQNLATEEFVRLRVTGGKPDKKVNEFVGSLELLPSRQDAMSAATFSPTEDEGVKAVSLSIDNTAWANTVIASHATTLAVIVYTGPQTRSALSTAPSRSKTGLLEYEINSLTKILCFLTLALSIILVALEGFSNTEGNVWYVKITRFLVLFSTIVPISLRVNLDMGKSVYSWFIQRDPGIPGAVVRTSTIPEDLGRIEYLLSDKTGTLTQNEMEMKKIHVGTVSYANDSMDEVSTYRPRALCQLLLWDMI